MRHFNENHVLIYEKILMGTARMVFVPDERWDYTGGVRSTHTHLLHAAGFSFEPTASASTLLHLYFTPPWDKI